MDPLDPLTEEEVRMAAAACRKHAAAQGLPELRFNTITLKEPPKKALLAYRANGGAPPKREAFCIVQAFPVAPVIETVIDLGGDEALPTSWTQVEGVQPLASPDDCFLAEDIVKEDPHIRASWPTPTTSQTCLLWPATPGLLGGTVNDPPVDGRLIQTFMYLRSSPDDNHYAHPLDFVPVVDLNLRKVVHVDKPYKSPPEIPSRDMNYHRSLFGGPWRSDLKPLDVVQPEGPSFTCLGNLVSWQKWAVPPRLQLARRRWREAEAGPPTGPPWWRCVCPTRIPTRPSSRKCAFDVGDYGLGFCANSLELGCDCLGAIKYFDAVLNDSRGEPMVIKKAVVPARGGCGPPLEAHGVPQRTRRGTAKARRLHPQLHCHRGQLRVCHVLALLPGWRPPVRDQADRRTVHQSAVPRGGRAWIWHAGCSGCECADAPAHVLACA
eukprot:jgi/Botrbrau1/13053/Bobra.0187s0015.1